MVDWNTAKNLCDSCSFYPRRKTPCRACRSFFGRKGKLKRFVPKGTFKPRQERIYARKTL